MNTSEIAIKVENLSKCYHIYDKPRDRLLQMLTRGRKQYFQEFWALKDVSFEIKKGETVGIIGRNGSGKSTLLQMICGTLNPTHGNVQTHGRVAALLELGSGFNPEFTGRENVYMNASVLGLSREEIDGRFDSIIAFADIGGFIEQPVKTYSSGMMVRLAFGVIAHVDADILVIDEALAVGDAFFTQKCMRFLRNFMETGTVLFVSHDTGSVLSLCSRALWIDKGQTIQDGSPKEVCEQYLEAFYEAQQGKGRTTDVRLGIAQQSDKQTRDARLSFINHSNLRNDLEIFNFDPSAPLFGKGDAKILDVVIQDSEGKKLSWVVGGEMVTISIFVQAITKLRQPIIGFLVRNHLGQNLFGDNTYLTTLNDDIKTKPDQLLIGEFTFIMPILPLGDYSVTVAVSDGTQQEHVVHQWIHDAIIFKSHATSTSTGLIGIPMHSIVLKAMDTESTDIDSIKS